MDELVGWCVVWIRKHSGIPVMTSNIADMDCAVKQVNHITSEGHKVVTYCKEAHLAKIVPLMTLCRELDMEMDGVKCPKAAAAILNAIRRIVGE